MRSSAFLYNAEVINKASRVSNLNHSEHMMKSSHFFLCCLFTLALYFLSHHTSSSQIVIPRPIRKLSMTIPVVQHEYHKIEVADEAMESYPPKEDSMTIEYTSNSKSPHDLVYNIDYHGVTTHPTPKHPKP